MHGGNSQTAVQLLNLDQGPCYRLDPALAWAVAWATKGGTSCVLHSLYEVLQLLVDGALQWQGVVAHPITKVSDAIGIIQLPFIDPEWRRITLNIGVIVHPEPYCNTSVVFAGSKGQVHLGRGSHSQSFVWTFQVYTNIVNASRGSMAGPPCVAHRGKRILRSHGACLEQGQESRSVAVCVGGIARPNVWWCRAHAPIRIQQKKCASMQVTCAKLNQHLCQGIPESIAFGRRP